LGGTIGDIEGRPYVEAFRQFQYRVGRSNFMNVHVSLIVETGDGHEQKTKPTQISVATLRGEGLFPDMVGVLTVCLLIVHVRAGSVSQSRADQRKYQEQTAHLL
jgi:CTP synthase (UTP-ammonia lyase)